MKKLIFFILLIVFCFSISGNVFKNSYVSFYVNYYKNGKLLIEPKVLIIRIAENKYFTVIKFKNNIKPFKIDSIKPNNKFILNHDFVYHNNNLSIYYILKNREKFIITLEDNLLIYIYKRSRKIIY
jgi:hypothetical protein